LVPIESVEIEESETIEPSQVEAQPARGRWRFWHALLTSIILHQGLVWILDAIPPRSGEALGLRWFRALGEHPCRAPLGLTLAGLAIAQFMRALSNRRPHA
jgi:hypothetical protein